MDTPTGLLTIKEASEWASGYLGKNLAVTTDIRLGDSKKVLKGLF